MIDQLNKTFAISGQLHIEAGPGGLPMIHIENAYAKAVISIYAGQVLSYQPLASNEDLLFCSALAYYQAGKAIKGGIPICWPWFGADPENKGRPAHGFARNRLWQLLETTATDNGEIQVTLGFSDDPTTREVWPHAFRLRLIVTVGARLELSLVTENTGDAPFQISQALHTYFAVGDITQTRVLGLESTHYQDKVAGGDDRLQSGPILIDREVDRIYTESPSALTIDDAALHRQIAITAGGSRTSVVWNPWSKIAAQMADLGDDDYQRMLCVETANAADDTITLSPGAEHRLTASYQLQ